MSPITVIVSVLAISVGNPLPVLPHVRDYHSENGQFVVRVQPAQQGLKPWIKVSQVQGGKRIPLWRCYVGNKSCPGRAYVSNDGTWVVTKDEWDTMGFISTHTDYVLAFHNKTGLIRRYSWDEIIECQGYVHRFSTGNTTWASETYVRDIEGRTLLCIWPWEKPDYWLVWDVATGNKVDVLPETTEACNKIARQWALNRLMQPGQPHDKLYSALSILGRLNVPEDRQCVASFLYSEDFITANNSSSGAYNAYSSIRNAAERILTAWDGTPVGRSGGIWQTHGYLGAVSGTIKLPRVPATDDQPFSIRLIPAASPKGHWYYEYCPQRLRAGFGKRSQPDSASIPFTFYQVTPGRYHVKAVWDVAEPHSFHGDKVTGPPAPGDYENHLAPLIEVLAGETSEGVLLDCTQPVGAASTTRWASECLPTPSAVRATCPCGKDHSAQRVCVVFGQPIPMERFNHGPYHNFGDASASLTQDGDVKTYSYSFAKDEQGLSEAERRQFDMGIQVVIVNDQLTRVTVEGPYLAVVPLSSLLRALSIDTTGLDDAAVESYTIHGKPMPRIGLPESLQRVTQILGRPSTSRANEATFSYKQANGRDYWIKLETSSNGLVLWCRTNLAGGTSFFGVASKDVM